MQIGIERLGDGPIIRPHMDDRMGDNINGPSLIRAPDWITKPLGKYYLYFGHHDGRYIRLATADDLAGPWRMHQPGVLPLDQSLFAGHIASPDVHVDEANQRIIMYYHGLEGPGYQHSRVAVSRDGINFTAREENLGRTYMRIFKHQGMTYALAMPGQFYRSRDGLTDFEEGPRLFEPNMRHSAVMLRDDVLYVFWTRVGDAPESILLSTIDISGDWSQWTESEEQLVLRPERDWEGANAPVEPSVRSTAYGQVNQLRDPALFEENGMIYLLYAVAGESGIALARIDF